MIISQAAIVITVLSFLAGAVHVLTPDHWLPCSMLAWQNRWRLRRTFAISALLLAVHFAAGAGLYFAALPIFRRFLPGWALAITIGVTLACILVRAIRYERGQVFFRRAPRGRWGLVSAALMLGPADSLVPILYKSGLIGVGYVIPLVAYFVGTMLVGVSAVIWGRFMWNTPQAVPMGLRWFDRRAAIPALLPAAAFVLFMARLA